MAELVERLEHAPGCCHNCRSAKAPQVLTTLVIEDDSPFTKVVYLCLHCVEAIGRAAGMLPPEDAQQAIDARDAEIEEVKAALARALQDGREVERAKQLLAIELARFRGEQERQAILEEVDREDVLRQEDAAREAERLELTR